MKTLSLFILLLQCSSSLISQSNSLNPYDSKGKKDGKWVIYLDDSWKQINDSSKAVYMRYTWFDHGTNIYPMGTCGGKGYKLESAAKTKMLDGTYTWYDAKGKLSSVHVLKNGEYVSCKEYYPSGGLNQEFDYNKKCEGESLGWTVYIYDRKGTLTLELPMCKDKNGNWPGTRG